MSVNDIGLECSALPREACELGAEKSCQRKPGAPRRSDVLSHVPGVRERFHASQRISKALDVDSLEIVTRWKISRRRCNNANSDACIAKSDRKTKEE